MQKKVDILTDILKAIRNERQRNYAISLVSDLINVINNQEKEILGLMAWKTDNKKQDIELELEKYVLILISFGFTQKFISNIRKESVLFIAKNRKSFEKKPPELFKNIDHWLMVFELENERQPNDFNELKIFIKNARD